MCLHDGHEGRWFTFDAKHNMPRIGRTVIARGLYGIDIPMFNSFWPHVLTRFVVVTEGVPLAPQVLVLLRVTCSFEYFIARKG